MLAAAGVCFSVKMTLLGICDMGIVSFSVLMLFWRHLAAILPLFRRYFAVILPLFTAIIAAIRRSYHLMILFAAVCRYFLKFKLLGMASLMLTRMLM